MSDLLQGLTGILLGDRFLKRVEAEMTEYFCVKHLFFISSGKAALTLILTALRSLSGRREVVIPAYTCFSVPSAVLKSGLKVIPCDLDPNTFDFDRSYLKRVMNDDTLCVLPSHLFGIPSNMDEINQLCKERGVYVVEDAAQAMGERNKGRLLGTFGDVGFFSLGRGKGITCGSGGIIVTNSDEISQEIAKQYAMLERPTLLESAKEFLELFFMVLFIRPSLYWFPAGMPFLKLGATVFDPDFKIKKLSGMKGAILSNWRHNLDWAIRIRSETSDYFMASLKLAGPKGVPVPYLRLPVVVKSREERDRLYAASERQGLGLSRMYPAPVSEIVEIRNHFIGKDFPTAKILSERLVTLPTHPLLSKSDKEAICRLFADCVDFRSSGGYERAHARSSLSQMGTS